MNAISFFVRTLTEQELLHQARQLLGFDDYERRPVDNRCLRVDVAEQTVYLLTDRAEYPVLPRNQRTRRVPC